MSPKSKICLTLTTFIVFLTIYGKAGWATDFEDVHGWMGGNVTEENSGVSMPGVDIDGKVGYSLTAYGPRAVCKDDNGQDATWTLSPTIESGTLPPGVAIGSPDSGFSISGIPTQRGHYIVTISFGSQHCNGTPEPAFVQQLRFHITGSGEVVQ